MKNINLETVSNLVLALIVIVFIGIIIYKSVSKTPIEFEYKKHLYIEFPNKGVVHDPNCKHCQLIFD